MTHQILTSRRLRLPFSVCCRADVLVVSALILQPGSLPASAGTLIKVRRCRDVVFMTSSSSLIMLAACAKHFASHFQFDLHHECQVHKML